MTQNDSRPFRPVAEIFVQEALSSGRAAGVDIAQVLSAADVVPDQLAQLSTEAFGRIWLGLSEQMRDEFFGLGARPMRPGSTTLLGHAIQGAPTLEVALRRALRFLKVVLDEPYGSLSIDGSLCEIRLVEQSLPRTAFAYRTFFLILHGFNCWVAKERIPIRSVAFPCAEPAAQNDYGTFFGAPVQFDAPFAKLTFDRKFLPRPAKRTEQDLKVFLRSLPEAFLRGYSDMDGLRHKIVATCLSGPARDWPKSEQVARALGMSRSGLYRQLRQDGQSLVQIKNEQRRKQAMSLLTDTDLPISEIAEQVGYAEESAFYRAFQRWVGATPGQLRASKRNSSGF